MVPVVIIEHLSFSYRGSEKQALRELDGQIEEGSFVALMGQGGAGKSTLCCAANGLVPRFFRGDYKGRFLVNGLDVTNCSIVELSRMVGLVLQDFEAQLFCTNVELEAAFGPENQGISREMIRQRVDRHLGFVGLASMRRRDSATLSGGQKQRLAIGSILAMEPRVLVMDEPVTDLDPLGRADILSISDRLRDMAQTLVIADNEPENVIKADRLWLMRDGEIAAQGPPEEIFSDLPLLQSCGIMVPPIVAFFRAMGWPGVPLSFEEAQMFIESHDYISLRGRPSGVTHVSRKGTNPILKARDLSFRYPGSPEDSLQKVDLDIHAGEFVAILGKNGSGKTTLAKHFNGLLKPVSGVMFVDGKPTTTHRARNLARLVGYVFQNPDHQIFAATVREEVGFGPRILGLDSRSIEENVQRALAATGLEGYEEASPFVLTKGERQRVAVASVLAVRPPVIVLDEPTTGLDHCHQLETMKMLKDLNEKGHTIIIITHTMWIAESFARRCIVMNNGKVIADGPTRTVFSDEEKLHEASLAPSPLVRLSNWLGTQSLTAEELAAELKS